MLTRTLSAGYTGSSPAISHRRDVTGDSEVSLSLRDADGNGLAASAANQEQQLGLDVANLKLLVISVTGNNGAVTIKTNSSGSPDKTFTIASGGGVVVWDKNGGEANPFGSTDVTTLFLSNPGTTVADVDFRALLNS